MRKSRLVALLFLVAALAGLAYLTLRAPEPMYEGKPMTYWLEGYTSYLRNRTALQQSDRAMEAIGTNAIPSLLKMLRAEDSPTKRELLDLQSAHPALHLHLHSAAEEHAMALWGFKALGANGKSAVPELTKLLGDNRQNVRDYTIGCLGAIGPASKPAIPALLQLLTNRFAPERVGAAMSLGRIHSQPDIVVPALTKELSEFDHGYELRPQLITALGEFGTNAKLVVPTIVPFLSAFHPQIRSAATNAIKRIDPENADKIFGRGKIGIQTSTVSATSFNFQMAAIGNRCEQCRENRTMFTLSWGTTVREAHIPYRETDLWRAWEATGPG